MSFLIAIGSAVVSFIAGAFATYGNWGGWGYSSGTRDPAERNPESGSEPEPEPSRPVDILDRGFMSHDGGYAFAEGKPNEQALKAAADSAVRNDIISALE